MLYKDLAVAIKNHPKTWRSHFYDFGVTIGTGKMQNGVDLRHLWLQDLLLPPRESKKWKEWRTSLQSIDCLQSFSMTFPRCEIQRLLIVFVFGFNICTEVDKNLKDQSGGDKRGIWYVNDLSMAIQWCQMQSSTSFVVCGFNVCFIVDKNLIRKPKSDLWSRDGYNDLKDCGVAVQSS